MIDCNAVREQLALHPTSDDQPLLDHLAECASCTMYRRQNHSIDTLLRCELQWKAPADLTARLLSLAVAPLLTTPAAPVRVRPKHWYVTTVYMLSLLAIALSFLIAWKFASLLAAQVELGTAVAYLLAAAPQGLSFLIETLPESRYVIAFFLYVRDQMTWLLTIAVLWAVLDKWNFQLTFRRPFSS